MVAKGKSVETFQPNEEVRESLLKAVLGRSGSLRAPTIKSGGIYYVGYNDALYSDPPFLKG